MLKVRQSHDCLILNMGIPIPGKTVFILRQGPEYQQPWYWLDGINGALISMLMHWRYRSLQEALCSYLRPELCCSIQRMYGRRSHPQLQMVSLQPRLYPRVHVVVQPCSLQLYMNGFQQRLHRQAPVLQDLTLDETGRLGGDEDRMINLLHRWLSARLQ